MRARRRRPDDALRRVRKASKGGRCCRCTSGSSSGTRAHLLGLPAGRVESSCSSLRELEGKSRAQSQRVLRGGGGARRGHSGEPAGSGLSVATRSARSASGHGELGELAAAELRARGARRSRVLDRLRPRHREEFCGDVELPATKRLVSGRAHALNALDQAMMDFASENAGRIHVKVRRPTPAAQLRQLGGWR